VLLVSLIIMDAILNKSVQRLVQRPCHP